MKYIQYVVCAVLVVLIPQSMYGNLKALEEAKKRYLKQEYKEVIQDFNQLTSDKDQKIRAIAQFYLGKIYYLGQGVEKDFEKSRDYFEKARDKTDDDEVVNLEILFYLGKIYYLGQGVKSNYVIAKNYFEDVFELTRNPSHKVASQFYLGSMYYSGQGVARDYAKACAYLEEVIRIPDNLSHKAWAELYLGDIYNTGGYGIERNLFRAEYFLRFALSQDDDRTVKDRAFEYRRHMETQKAAKAYRPLFAGVFATAQELYRKKSYEEAQKQLEKVVRQDTDKYTKARGQVLLGKILYQADPADKRMHELFDAAANQMDNNAARAEALYLKGEIFFKEKKYAEAQSFFEQAIEQNKDLGLMIKDPIRLGELIEKEHIGLGELVKEYLRLRELMIKAHLRLGELCYDQQKYKEALDQFNLVAKQKNNKHEQVTAQLYLGKSYYYGHGVLKDLAHAQHWLQVAADQNVNLRAKDNARIQLGKLYLEKKDFTRAEEFFKRALESQFDDIRQKAQQNLQELQELTKKRASDENQLKILLQAVTQLDLKKVDLKTLYPVDLGLDAFYLYYFLPVEKIKLPGSKVYRIRPIKKTVQELLELAAQQDEFPEIRQEAQELLKK